jgi:hypothetical protein
MDKDRDLGEILRFRSKQLYPRFLQYARARGFPLRRIKYLARNAPKIALYTVAVCAILLFLDLVLVWLGHEWVVFLSPENQAQWFAEILIIIFAGVFLHFALRERGAPSPSLTLEDIEVYQTKDGRRVFGVKIKNDGDYAATDCRATFEMKGIEKADIQDNKSTEFKDSNTELSVDLCWDRTSKEKSKTLRSDDTGELLVARWVPEDKRGRAEHFAIVGDRGWGSTSMKLATVPSHYFGKVRIAPLNGKACYVSVCLKKDAQVGAIMELAM